MAAVNNRGLVLRTKLLLPEPVWRAITRPAAWLLRAAPDSLKYGLGLRSRAKAMPYSLIEPGDVVFQIGAPADLLAVGRSRAGFFLHLARGGRVVVMEPDKRNCQALEAFARRNGFSDRLIAIAKGGWDKETTLGFFASKTHQASAQVQELATADTADMKARGWELTEVEVTTVDKVMAEYQVPTPKLVSITTNGAEPQILRGMEELFKTGPKYIALAIDDERYASEMPRRGYTLIAEDDRGYTFERTAG